MVGSHEEIFQCPHCGALSLHSLLEPMKGMEGYLETIKLKAKDGGEIEADVRRCHFIYRCVGCKKDTYFLFQPETGPSSGGGAGHFGWVAQRPVGEIKATPRTEQEVIHQFPVVTPTIHLSVPEDVRKATLEAEKCLSVGAYNACGVMTRRAMHALCQDKGAQGKVLHDQLKYLRDNHQITPDLWDWAEELRIVGRAGAHPEWEEVSSNDADYAVRFLREIIRYIYINPSERAARKLRETAQKKPTS